MTYVVGGSVALADEPVIDPDTFTRADYDDHEPTFVASIRPEPSDFAAALRPSGRWLDEANCRGMNPNVFFPEKGDAEGARLARQVCSGCTVRDQCLEANLTQRGGIWGGLNDRERQRLRASRRRSVA